jgi:hypothetical protein
MSKKAPWFAALLVGAGLAGPASAQTVHREDRGPLVVDRGSGYVAGPILVVDGPQDGQTVSGVVSVSGFVLDMNSIDKIELFIDTVDIPVNRAVLNFPRPEVIAAFPSFATGPTGNPGWITSFLARNFLDGQHSLILAVTESGAAGPILFGPIQVNVDNTINQAPFGNIDVPGADSTLGANGSFPVLGWALDDSDIDHIDFLVDGTIVATAVGRGGVGNAVFGGTRPDIYAAFPDFPGPLPKSLYSGFLANLDSTRLLGGMHELLVRAYDDQGAGNDIGTRIFQVENVGGLLGPFGVLDYPLDEATLICGPGVTISTGGGCPSPCVPGGGGGGPTPAAFFPNIVRGWALDVGARLDAGQVSYVELLLDGSIVANTRTDCVVGGTTFNNCYGVNRPDVAHNYQGYVNAANSGFRFAFGLTRDPFIGLLQVIIPTTFGPALSSYTVPGKHTLSVRAGDEEETVSEFGAISVDITCDTTVTTPDKASFGNIDAPGPEQFINGLFTVFGWAYDFDSGVTSVDIEVDGFFKANLNKPAGTYGLRRDDVVATDNRVPTPFVGFVYALDTTLLGDTEHDLTAYAFDPAGHRTLIGRRKFVVFNNTSTKQ